MNVYSSAPGDFLITASVPNKSASKTVHFRGVSTAQLAVTSVLPNRGKPQGGDPVTINGQGFKQPLAVNFIIGATSYAAAVVPVAADGSSIAATTPQVPATAGDQVAAVQVTLTGIAAPGGGFLSATLANAFTFGADTGAPQLNSVVPTSGLASGGEVITLTGRNFTEPLQVSFVFPGMTVPGVVGSVTHGADGFDIAHVTTPKVTITASTLVGITITNAVGSAASKTATFNQVFTFLLSPGGPPVIFYIAPTFGSVQGHETVLIYGQNFTAGATVTIGPTPEAVVHVAEDGTMIQIMTNPVGGQPPTGPQDVTVTTTAGTFTLSGAFTYLEGATPQLYMLSPNLGPIEGGTRVTITGTGFQYPVQVLFGDPAGAGRDDQLQPGRVHLAEHHAPAAGHAGHGRRHGDQHIEREAVQLAAVPVRPGDVHLLDRAGRGPRHRGHVRDDLRPGVHAPVAVSFDRHRRGEHPDRLRDGGRRHDGRRAGALSAIARAHSAP